MTQAKTNLKIFKKGKPKTGGRKPGVPNKLTRIMQRRLADVAQIIDLA
jgi:hypothetical protein